MARYEHLKIYKDAMDMALYFEQIVRNFSRYNKYTIGSDLRNKSREIACQIMRANSMRDKEAALRELVSLMEELKVLIRLCGESKAFYNANSYYHSSRLLAGVSTQAQAWLDYSIHDGRRSVP
jgi:hypothetical protein